MRTTLVIDDDVLEAARCLAAEEHKSLGEIVSGLARRGLTPAPWTAPAGTRNGIPLLRRSSGARPVTPELVKRLFDSNA